MKKGLGIMVLIGLLWLMAGCSALVAPPRVARIYIRGPANQTKEFSVSLDDLTQRNTDIHLSDRYAFNIDLQWLWYTHEDFDQYADEYHVDSHTPLTPWVLCKYRF